MVKFLAKLCKIVKISALNHLQKDVLLSKSFPLYIQKNKRFRNTLSSSFPISVSVFSRYCYTCFSFPSPSFSCWQWNKNKFCCAKSCEEVLTYLFPIPAVLPTCSLLNLQNFWQNWKLPLKSEIGPDKWQRPRAAHALVQNFSFHPYCSFYRWEFSGDGSDFQMHPGT